jgi:hypothetical protein
MTISWTKTGDVGTYVRVYYSTNNQITWNKIDSVGAESGTQVNWTTPITVFPEVFIKVEGNKPGVTPLISESFSIGKTATITNVVLGGADYNTSTHNIAQGKDLQISWQTTGEIGTSVKLSYSTDNQNWTPIGTISATSPTTWTTPAVNIPEIYIRISSLTDAAIYGTSEKFSIGALSVYSEEPVGGYSITNYPNPFTAQTNISFTMAERGFVTMTLRDELGREVARLANANFEAGQQNVTLDAAKLPAGIYSCTFETNGVHLVKKLTVTK